MAFVYIIQDVISKRHYIGSCIDVEKRIKRHRSHTGGSTTKNGLWELVCFKEFGSLSEARFWEKKNKSYKGGNAFKKIIEEWRRG